MTSRSSVRLTSMMFAKSISGLSETSIRFSESSRRARPRPKRRKLTGMIKRFTRFRQLQADKVQFKALQEYNALGSWTLFRKDDLSVIPASTGVARPRDGVLP